MEQAALTGFTADQFELPADRPCQPARDVQAQTGSACRHRAAIFNAGEPLEQPIPLGFRDATTVVLDGDLNLIAILGKAHLDLGRLVTVQNCVPQEVFDNRAHVLGITTCGHRVLGADQPYLRADEHAVPGKLGYGRSDCRDDIEIADLDVKGSGFDPDREQQLVRQPAEFCRLVFDDLDGQHLIRSVDRAIAEHRGVAPQQRYWGAKLVSGEIEKPALDLIRRAEFLQQAGGP